MRRLLVVTTLVLFLLGAGSAQACGPGGSKVRFRTERIVVVFKVLEKSGEPGRTRRHYACARGSSRSYVLDDPNADDDPYGELWDHAYLFSANGGYLAYVREAGDADGNYLFAEVVVLNIRTGRRRISNGMIDEQWSFATDLVVTRRGRAAWIVAQGYRDGAERTGPWEVRRLVPKKPREPGLLYSGEGIAPRSLVLGRGGRAVWRHGPARRSAEL